MKHYMRLLHCIRPSGWFVFLANLSPLLLFCSQNSSLEKSHFAACPDPLTLVDQSGEFYQPNRLKPFYEKTLESCALTTLLIPESRKKTWGRFIAASPWIAPEPQVSEQYGADIDVRPPITLIHFFSGMEVLEGSTLPSLETPCAKTIYIGIPPSFRDSDSWLWAKFMAAIERVQIPLSHFGIHGGAKVYTSWVSWDPEIQKMDSQGRYAISLVKLKNKKDMRYLKIEQLAFSRADAEGDPLTAQDETPLAARKLHILTNQIMCEFEKIRRLERTIFFLKEYPHLILEAKKDAQGLPKFAIRAPHEFIWHIFPLLLKKCYMSSSPDRVKGEMLCDYFPPDTRVDQPVVYLPHGHRTLDLLPGNYCLQLFDLGESTEFQWCNAQTGAVLQEGQEIFFKPLSELFYDYQRFFSETDEKESILSN